MKTSQNRGEEVEKELPALPLGPRLAPDKVIHFTKVSLDGHWTVHWTAQNPWYIYICHVIYGKYFVYQFYFQFVKIWRRSRSRGYDNYYQC